MRKRQRKKNFRKLRGWDLVRGIRRVFLDQAACDQLCLTELIDTMGLIDNQWKPRPLYFPLVPTPSID